MSGDIPALIADARAHPNPSAARLLDALEVQHRLSEAALQRVTDLELRLQQYMDMLEDYSVKSRQAQARIADLEAALEPFRKPGKAMEDDAPDKFVYGVRSHEPDRSYELYAGHFQNARAVLEKAE